jgi:hypothetical protein
LVDEATRDNRTPETITPYTFEVNIMAEHAELKGKIENLGALVGKLHGAKHAENLVRIIHKPGWTTVREVELVTAHVNALHGQARALHQSFDELLTIADKIGA